MKQSNQATQPTRLTINDVMGRLERGENILFIDCRNPRAWSQSNVKLPGAIRVPAEEVSRHTGELPRDGTIVTYCTWQNEASSARVAAELIELGFDDIHPLYGGFDAWVEAGFPVEPK